MINPVTCASISGESAPVHTNGRRIALCTNRIFATPIIAGFISLNRPAFLGMKKIDGLLERLKMAEKAKEYQTVLKSIMVKTKESDINDGGATVICLEDVGGGLFVAVEQDEARIGINPDEWPHIRDAIEKMLGQIANIESDNKETRLVNDGRKCLEEYFDRMRKLDCVHLGMGDIRMKVGMQEKLLETLFPRVPVGMMEAE